MTWTNDDRREYRSDMRAAMQEGRWTAMGFIFKVFVPIFLVCAVLAGGWWMISRPAQVIDRVTNPDRVVYQYEWFYDTLNSCKALDQKVTNAEADVTKFEEQMGDTPRNEWGYSNTQEYGRLQTTLTAVKNRRAELAGEYNSRGEQMTRKWLKGKSLPESIPLDGPTPEF